jgi:GNAT superfamily N-acetyltransferase
MNFQIRTLSLDEDYSQLTAVIHRAYAKLGAMGLNYTAVDQSIETTRKRCAFGTCFIAQRDDQLIGTITVAGPEPQHECVQYQTIAHAHQFAVDPAAQGKGVGKALMLAAEQWVAAQGLLAIAVDTAEQATHLIALYNRWGYQTIGLTQWPGKVYRSVVMHKSLGIVI